MNCNPTPRTSEGFCFGYFFKRTRLVLVIEDKQNNKRLLYETHI